MPKSSVQAAFEKQIVVLPLNIIVPQRTITNAQRECDFYRQITASLRHIGLIEPLVVYPRAPGEYLLLDGHVRLEILKSLGVTEAKCLLSTDDEAYTYNRHVNQIPPIAQHFMLLGVSQKRSDRRAHRGGARCQHRLYSVKAGHAEWNLSGSSPAPPRKARQYSRLRDFEEDEALPSDRSRRAHGCRRHIHGPIC